MVDIYYLIGVLVAILNIGCLYKHKKVFDVTEWIFKFKEITGKNPTTQDFRDGNSYVVLLTWSITVILTVFWLFVGLFSRNWPLFLAIMGFNVILNRLLRKIKYNSVKRYVLVLKSLVITSFIVFMIINHFHLKKDLINLIF